MAPSCPGSTSNSILDLNIPLFELRPPPPPPPYLHPERRLYVSPLGMLAHLSQCLDTAGCGNRCPSLHPRYSNTPATSRSGPRYCHMRLEPLCRSSILGAHCSQVPAWVGWVFGVGVGVEAWLEDWGRQVLGAVSLGTYLKKQMALARHALCLLLSHVSDGENRPRGYQPSVAEQDGTLRGLAGQMRSHVTQHDPCLYIPRARIISVPPSYPNLEPYEC